MLAEAAAAAANGVLAEGAPHAVLAEAAAAAANGVRADGAPHAVLAEAAAAAANGVRADGALHAVLAEAANAFGLRAPAALHLMWAVEPCRHAAVTRDLRLQTVRLAAQLFERRGSMTHCQA